jgi:hypothetical protein
MHKFANVSPGLITKSLRLGLQEERHGECRQFCVCVCCVCFCAICDVVDVDVVSGNEESENKMAFISVY